MRVTAYLHSYPPGRLLGGELMTSLLLEALVDAGHDVSVIAQTVEEPRERNGVRVLPKRKAMLADDMAGTDVFISHPEIAAFARNRIGDAAYVGIVHNLQPGTIDGLKITRPDLIVANAKATANRVRHYGRDCITLHPPTPAGRHPKPAGLSGRFVTLVNLSEAKGGRLFYELAARRPDLDFLGVVGGHGEQLYPSTLPRNVFILGQSESMGVVYGLTRVLLFPSETETYGMVAAEAALAGIPVIAHPLPGVFEALEDAAAWVDRTDVEGWERELALLDNDDHYAAAAAAAAIRGDYLAQRSRDDLTRFVDTVEQLAHKQR